MIVCPWLGLIKCIIMSILLRSVLILCKINVVNFRYGPEKLGLVDGSIPDESLSTSSNWEGKRSSIPVDGCLKKIPSDFLTIGVLCMGVVRESKFADHGCALLVASPLSCSI